MLEIRPKWDSLFVVCKDCRRRSNGPTDTKPRHLVTLIRAATRDDAPRPRVVCSSCLGLCPKRATAIAIVGSAAPRLIGVKTGKRLDRELTRWRDGSARAED